MKNLKSIAIMAWWGEPFEFHTLYPFIAPPSDGLGSNFWSSIWTSFIFIIPSFVSLGPSRSP